MKRFGLHFRYRTAKTLTCPHGELNDAACVVQTSSQADAKKIGKTMAEQHSGWFIGLIPVEMANNSREKWE